MPHAGLRKLVSAIPGTPSPYGLLGPCVDVVPMTDVHEGNGTEFVPIACNIARNRTWCPDPVAAKVFDRPGVCSFEPIAIYAGSTCSTFGQDQDEAIERARTQLELGAQRALEEFFMTELCQMAAGNDLTPAAGALHIAQGFGVLESWLASNYGGQGLIHAPAGTAALISMHRLVDWPGGTCPRTLMGNGVVLGAGYAANVGGAACTAAPAGEAWLYATGPVRVRQSDVQILPDSERLSINTTVNDRTVMAEQGFVVETACCEAAMVRVSLTACP